MNLGDEYQNLLIFIALIIAGDESWAANLQQFPPNLLPAMKVGDGAHRRDGNQALVNLRREFMKHAIVISLIYLLLFFFWYYILFLRFPSNN